MMIFQGIQGVSLEFFFYTHFYFNKENYHMILEEISMKLKFYHK